MPWTISQLTLEFFYGKLFLLCIVSLYAYSSLSTDLYGPPCMNDIFLLYNSLLYTGYCAISCENIIMYIKN